MPSFAANSLAMETVGLDLIRPVPPQVSEEDGNVPEWTKDMIIFDLQQNLQMALVHIAALQGPYHVMRCISAALATSETYFRMRERQRRNKTTSDCSEPCPSTPCT